MDTTNNEKSSKSDQYPGGKGKDHEEMQDDLSDEVKEAEHFCDVINHFSNYASHCFRKFERLGEDFDHMPDHLKRLVPSMHPKLEKLRRAVAMNQAFIRKLVQHRAAFQNPELDYAHIAAKPWRPNEERASKVRSTLRQCVRDWGADGAQEREQCYSPIMKELERLFPDKAARSKQRVLVPGSGLGRLTWEVAKQGFYSQGNEFSYYMLVCSYYILNMVDSEDQIVLNPWVWDTKNNISEDSQLKAVTIPDVNPASLPQTAQFSMVAGDFTEVFPDPCSWDAIASCFFIDTAHNILEYVEVIARILKVGGYWINFGPLLYHFADVPKERSVELTYEELKATFPSFGLKLLQEQTDLPSGYTGKPAGMLQQEYRCVFFTVVKVDNSVEIMVADAEKAKAAAAAASTAASPASPDCCVPCL